MKTEQHFTKPGSAEQPYVSQPPLAPNRREFLAGLMGAALLSTVNPADGVAQESNLALNIARVALDRKSVV